MALKQPPTVTVRQLIEGSGPVHLRRKEYWSLIMVKTRVVVAAAAAAAASINQYMNDVHH